MRFLALAFLLLSSPLAAQQADDAAEGPQPVFPLMTLDRLNELILLADDKARRNETGTIWDLTLDDVSLKIITDPRANRMRIMAAIAPATDLTPEDLRRMMQANFDAALDARYAIARDILWSVFIHPLNPLDSGQLLSALAQTVVTAKTYGDSYTSGALTFGGGDSNALLQRKLLDELQRRSQQQGT